MFSILEFGILFQSPAGQTIKVAIDFGLLAVSFLLILGAEGWKKRADNKWQGPLLTVVSLVFDLIFLAKMFVPLLYLIGSAIYK